MIVSDLAELVDRVESDLQAGRNNATISFADCDHEYWKDVRLTDQAFIDAGWRLKVFGKGKWLVKGSWYVFTRGCCGPSVQVQWGFLDDTGEEMANSLREPERFCDKCECRASITTLQSDAHQLRLAIDAGGFDLSPCGECGTLVVCVPDGLPLCKDCVPDE